MFIGHYGVSFAAKAIDRRIPLWVLFIAVQLLDVFWAPFVLLGVEKVRIVPGITASNPLDLYYMPYTHGLPAAVFWAMIALVGYRLWRGPQTETRAALLVALAVFSHWVLDFVVHRPDLPLYGNMAKVGLGLWNRPVLALVLETGLLFGSMALYLRDQRRGRGGLMAFGLVMLGIQVLVFFGPPPPSVRIAAVSALVAFAAFAGVIAWWERRHGATVPNAA